MIGGRRLVVRSTFGVAFAFLGLAIATSRTRAALVTVEAESGTLGANFIVGNSGGTIYISNTNNNATSTPGIAARVASCSVTFPEAGTYDLYARIRIGANTAADDSFV